MTPAPPPPQNLTPPQVFEHAKRLMSMGDFHEAAQRAALLRAHFPNDTPMLALHGLCMGALGLHELALEDLNRAADATEHALDNGPGDNPNRPRIADQLVRVCTQLARSHEALGDPDAADAALKRALDTDPEDSSAILAKVEMLARRGHPAEARALLDQADQLGLEPLPSAMGAGAVALARPDTTEDEFRLLAQRLHAQAEQVGHDAAALAPALRRAGALFDRAGKHDEAFRAFTRAANFTRGAFDPAAHAKLTNAVIANWTPDAMARIKRPERDASAHIFVFGAPGSGAEELARALTRRPDIASSGPSEVLTQAAVRHVRADQSSHRPALATPAGLRGNQLEALATTYAKHSARNALPKDRPTIADSGSLHAHLLGLGALALPGASFVFVRRDPRQNALACYFDALPGNHPYQKELATTAAYLRDIDRLTDHWVSTLPALGVTVVETTREALAASPAAETARILSEIGLSAAAVNPHFDPSPADHPDHYARRLEPVLSLLPKPRPIPDA